MAQSPLTGSVTAGDIRFRVDFLSRAPRVDGAGNTEGPYEVRFRRWARITPLKGGEEVMAARLQGTQPAIIRVRSDSNTRQVTSQWRARDTINNVDYNIRTLSNIDERNIWLDIMAEAGVPG